MKYMLGCGYHEGSQYDHEFSRLWVQNVERFASPQPEAIVILSTEGDPYALVKGSRITVLTCNHNLGHVGHLLSGEKKNQLCGWSASFLTLGMLAYNMGLDLLFQEQDCLAFGPYVERMYQDIGDGSMVFGAKMRSQPWMASAQSLVLVRHSYILTMVRNYIDQGWDRRESLPEDKFARIEEMDPGQVRRLSFGYDRERPINFDDPVWSAQKLNGEELKELRRRGLI